MRAATGVPYALRTALGRRGTGALFFFIAAAILWTSLFSTARFTQRDAYDYAQLGRQLQTGQGYSTLQLFPRDIPYFEQHGTLATPPWPSLHRYPLPPVVSALFQAFSPDIITAAVVQSGVLFLLSVPLFFLLAERFTSISVASLATLLYIGNPRLVRAAYDGMTESPAILLLLVASYTAFRPRTLEGRGRNWIFLGVLCGLIYLTRTQLVFVTPLAVLLALSVTPSGRRIRSALLLLVGAAVTVLPWHARAYVVAGHPFFSLTNSRAFLSSTKSGSMIVRILDAPIESTAVLERYGAEIGDKILHNLWPNLIDPRFWVGTLGIYASVFLFSALCRLLRKQPPPRDFALFEVSALAFCLANFLLVSLSYHRIRYYDTTLPFFIIVGSQSVWWLIERTLPESPATRRPRALLFVSLFVLAGIQALLTWTDHATNHARDPREAPAYGLLAEAVGPSSVVLSDLSLEITVFNGNPTIRHPIEPREILEITDRYLPIDYLVFSERQQGVPKYEAFVESTGFKERFRPLMRLPNEAIVYQPTEARGSPN